MRILPRIATGRATRKAGTARGLTRVTNGVRMDLDGKYLSGKSPGGRGPDQKSPDEKNPGESTVVDLLKDTTAFPTGMPRMNVRVGMVLCERDRPDGLNEVIVVDADSYGLVFCLWNVGSFS